MFVQLIVAPFPSLLKPSMGVMQFSSKPLCRIFDPERNTLSQQCASAVKQKKIKFSVGEKESNALYASYARCWWWGK